jgi:hypothetical protein
MGSPIRIRCATSRGRTRRTGRRGYVAVRSPGAARSVPARLLRGLECVRLLSWCGGSLISLDSAIIRSSIRRRAARGGPAPRAGARAPRGISRLFGYAERSAVRLGLYAIPTGREGEQRSWIKPVLSSLCRPSVSGRRRSDGRACPPLCRAAHLCRTPNTRVDAAQTHAAARRNTVIPTHS